MSEENTQLSVTEMIRMTGTNTANFMEQIADHIEKLEYELVTLRERVAKFELESDIKNA